MYITSGLLVIALATFTKVLLVIYIKIIKLGGIILQGAYAFAKEVKNLIKPDILFDPAIVFRKI